MSDHEMGDANKDKKTVIVTPKMTSENMALMYYNNLDSIRLKINTITESFIRDLTEICEIFQLIQSHRVSLIDIKNNLVLNHGQSQKLFSGSIAFATRNVLINKWLNLIHVSILLHISAVLKSAAMKNCYLRSSFVSIEKIIDWFIKMKILLFF